MAHTDASGESAQLLLASPPRQQQQQQHSSPSSSSGGGGGDGGGSMDYSSSAAPRTGSYTPTAASSQAPAALPPISHFESQHSSMQSHSHPHPHAPPYPGVLMNNGAPMQQQHPPSPYPPPPYQQYQNGALSGAPMPPATNGQNSSSMMRYPIPPQAPIDARSMGAARHKKEIKRRTKTGCLTCRKRRIKCDEAHPTCRNCHKSKRECLGYDPIFKQQPAPANIQPAPAGSNPPPSSHDSVVNSALPQSSYQPASQSYPGSGGVYIPGAGEQHYGGEYNSTTSLDPALSGGDLSAHMAHNNYPALQPHRRAKRISIEELFSLNDIPPKYNLRQAPPPISSATQLELDTFYKYHYAIGLDQLFETTWYSSRGLAHLQHDPVLQDFVVQCAEQFKAKKNDEATNRPLLSLEARLVWCLAQMPRAAAASANGVGGESLIQELLPRIDTVESLLTGQFHDPHRIPPLPPPPPPPPQSQPSQPNPDLSMANQKNDERAFWHHLARFTSLRDDDPATSKDVGEALVVLRKILNMLENRDVLYSIAVGRHIGGRMPDFHPQRHLVASTNDPEDNINKLKVAHQFIEGEDQRGTTQVIQRICSMAIRGWVLQKQ